ncbi:YceI family protein [Tolumonas auensis DSM 9187]|uniref:YceI family protein n=1 Tax=Tolumonas auensis (strain DSM 9187 / NBRC 110442 / TA 4) TaxID=595494 RepID=C4LA57_TOLAT|nr:YceI family protein [Tolumonas auensis]ACQ92186.1 YceI family protein [Tolumonas auensis DSM 9187]NCB57329.1 polyisoprenoid-binding protein [Gammaproteobacteria bacterium]
MNKFVKLSAVLALATAVSAPAFAAPETYVIDGSHTFPRFSYSHFGLSKQLSRFDKTSGTIVLDKEAKTGSVDIVIDTTSVDTGFPVFNGHIQGADFLDTTAFPTATFKSTKVVFKGDAPTEVQGDLTIKGVTKPVTLTVTSFVAMPHPMLQKDAIGANATTVIKRTDFNAGKYAPNVGDDVTIDIAVEAIKQ